VPPLIGTSWKMNLTSSDAARYFETLLGLVAGLDGVDLFVLPPFTSIWVARDRLAGTRIRWGAQDVHPDDAGAHTGDISAPMLADLGCSIVEVGHSERRRDYSEIDELIARKVAAVQRWGMTALLCVGEPRRIAEVEAIAHVAMQLAALAHADPNQLIVAYEPVWAIGEGATAAEPAWIGALHAAIRQRLDQVFAPVVVPLLYGGSVDSTTAAETLSAPAVDGLFVGRSALNPNEFARIAQIGHASQTRASGARG
jgi:triosephosphate isomerase